MMHPKTMATGGMSKKGYAAGGAVKTMAKKGYAAGGMPMVEKDGMKMPAFAADGKGKMAKGGAVTKKMMYGGMPMAKGGAVKPMEKKAGKPAIAIMIGVAKPAAKAAKKGK